MDIEIYKECGTKSASARFHGDESTARHWKDHYNNCLALESEEGQVKLACRQAFDEAYRNTSCKLRGFK